MRPITLEIENFLSYKGKHGIDFSELDFFVIVGGTGAGKSSLIEAICFALFGKVPRGNLSAKELINQKTDGQTRVRFSFSLKREIFTIERTLEDGEQKVVLKKPDGKLEDGVKKVGKEIKSILGIDFNAFTKIVHLPQGMFSNFLKPNKPEDRRNILLDILGFRKILERVNEVLSNEYTQKRSELSFLENQNKQYENINQDTLRKVNEEIQSKKETLESLQREKADLEKMHESCIKRDSLFGEKRQKEEALRKLNSLRAEYQVKERLYEIVKRLYPHKYNLSQLEDLKQRLKKDESELDKKRQELRLREEKIQEKEQGLLKLKQELDKLEQEKSKSVDIRLTIEKLKIIEEQKLIIESIDRSIAECVEELRQNQRQEQELLSKKPDIESRLSQIDKILSEWQRVTLLEEKNKNLRDYEKDIQKQRDNLDKIEKEINNLEASTRKMSSELSKLSEEYEILFKEVEEKEKERSILTKELNSLNQLTEKIKALESAENIARDLRKLRKTLFEKRKELSNIIEELEKEKQKGALESLAVKIRALLSEDQRCPVCGGEITNELRSSSDLEYKKEDYFERLIERFHSLKAEEKLLEEELRSLRDELRRKVSGLERVKLKSARKRLEKLPEELSKISQEEEIKRRKLNDIKKKIDTINDALARENVTLGQKRAEKKTLEELLGNLSTKLEVLSKEIKEEIGYFSQVCRQELSEGRGNI
ncbi:MAG: SMC family ATPase [Aquificaceae bacterium]|nr:SMC family ATPase [Aquificaceae bacterium]